MSLEWCMLCQERIPPGEVANGDFVDERGQRRKVHADCALRVVIGGIGHLENCEHWCKRMGDPDGGLSYRESARLARQWFEEHKHDET